MGGDPVPPFPPTGHQSPDNGGDTAGVVGAGYARLTRRPQGVVTRAVEMDHTPLRVHPRLVEGADGHPGLDAFGPPQAPVLVLVGRRPFRATPSQGVTTPRNIDLRRPVVDGVRRRPRVVARLRGVPRPYTDGPPVGVPAPPVPRVPRPSNKAVGPFRPYGVRDVAQVVPVGHPTGTVGPVGRRLPGRPTGGARRLLNDQALDRRDSATIADPRPAPPPFGRTVAGRLRISYRHSEDTPVKGAVDPFPTRHVDAGAMTATGFDAVVTVGHAAPRP